MTASVPFPLRGAAVFSPDRLYRYLLWREVAPLLGRGQVTFIMLNPSTADETKDDPTVRRCIRFAASWGFASLVVVNVYGYRATDPRELGRVDDPVGPENFPSIERAISTSGLVVCAWGARVPPEAAAVVLDLIDAPHTLGLTKDGHPRHPLYVSKATTPIPFAHCSEEDAWTRPSG